MISGYVFPRVLRPLRTNCNSCTTDREMLWDFRKRVVCQHLKTHFVTRSFDCSFKNSGDNSARLGKLFQRLSCKCNETLILLGEILTKQCNFYASQRLRRMSQIWNLYTRLYNEKNLNHMVSKLVKSLRVHRKKPFGFLLAGSLFSWETEKITEDEIRCCIEELDEFHTNTRVSNVPRLCQFAINEKLHFDGWEPIISKENLYVWRKSMPGTYLYEYKVLGTFFDVPARAFFNVQIDTEYRKKWDKLVIKLDVVDRENEENGCEVVHWVMHYPYPMYSRDYVYIRRAIVDNDNSTMVLVSRAINHPDCPVSDKYVRVTKYSSRMVIRPHKGFDDNGFDCLLTYFDDPQAAFPAPAYNWMASSGVPDFVEKLHHAAKELHYQARTKAQSLPEANTAAGGSTCPSAGVQYAYA